MVILYQILDLNKDFAKLELKIQDLVPTEN